MPLNLTDFREAARCKIEVAGSEIGALYPFVKEVRIEANRFDAATATLTLESRRDERGRWTVQDAGVFRPWRPIVVSAVFGLRSEEILRGYIREVNAAYPEDCNSQVTVECQDESIALDRKHRRQVWGSAATTAAPAAALEDRAIAGQILAEHGLGLDPDSGAGLGGLVLNQDSTDIAFLRRRAKINGYELIFRNRRAYFGPPRLSGAPQATIRVYAGKDSHCFDFSVQVDGHQPDGVAFETAAREGTGAMGRTLTPDLPPLGPDPVDSGRAGLDDFTWLLSRREAAEERELAALAQARANEASFKVRARGELDGALYGHVLLPGKPVGVDGIGRQLAGIYYVDAVTHLFSGDGYRQQFRLLRNALGDNLAFGLGSRLRSGLSAVLASIL